MKQQILTFVFMAASALMATAADEVMNVTLKDGTVRTFNVADVKEITFGEAPVTAGYVGTFTGTVTMNVGGMYDYPVDIQVEVTADGDKLNVSIPEFTMTNTVMGDVTLGAITLQGLEYDEAQEGFFLNYGGKGLQQHMTALQNGNPTFNKDYALLDPSTILLKKTADGISYTNPFKLGTMPFPMKASFTGSLRH